MEERFFKQLDWKSQANGISRVSPLADTRGSNSLEPCGGQSRLSGSDLRRGRPSGSQVGNPRGHDHVGVRWDRG